MSGPHWGESTRVATGRLLTQGLGLPRPRPCARPPPHAGYFPPSRRRKWPAVRPCPRGAFSGAPAPSGSRVRTWPSPQDSQCASGQTYLLQPTTLGVLASRLAINLSFLPPRPARPPPCKRSSDWPGFPGQPIAAPLTASAGARASEKPLNGCQGQRGTPTSAAPARTREGGAGEGSGGEGRLRLRRSGERARPRAEVRTQIQPRSPPPLRIAILTQRRGCFFHDRGHDMGHGGSIGTGIHHLLFSG